MTEPRKVHPTIQKQMDKAAKRRARLQALKDSGLTLEEIGAKERPPIGRERVRQILAPKA